MTRTITLLVLLQLTLCHALHASADTFGSGDNTFEIEFVTISNPDNPDDTTGAPNRAGKVEYAYRIGKYEISENMINKANALGGLDITHDNRGANKPATDVTWFEAATFVNWLNTSTVHMPAYKFNGSTFELWQPGDAGYNPANPFRNSQASYFLPSADEWYKAAYYDPQEGVYHDFATGSDGVPDGIDFVGDTEFDAVFWDGNSNAVPNDITDVGVFSPYGTAGQGGNVWEWEETEFDLINDSSSTARGVRGGFWGGPSSSLLASHRDGWSASGASVTRGFRVASVPEPSSLLLGSLGMLGIALWRKWAR